MLGFSFQRLGKEGQVLQPEITRKAKGCLLNMAAKESDSAGIAKQPGRSLQSGSGTLARSRGAGVLEYSMATLPTGMVCSHKSKTHFRAEDGSIPSFFIDGTLALGSLAFVVVADLGGKRGSFSGRDFFDAMMAHFGNQVKVISACWSDARQDLKTNLDIFNAETIKGISKEMAAFATKTGKWAKDYDFRIILNIDTIPDNFPGGYEQVLVDFIKPPKVKSPRRRKP